MNDIDDDVSIPRLPSKEAVDAVEAVLLDRELAKQWITERLERIPHTAIWLDPALAESCGASIDRLIADGATVDLERGIAVMSVTTPDQVIRSRGWLVVGAKDLHAVRLRLAEEDILKLLAAEGHDVSAPSAPVSLPDPPVPAESPPGRKPGQSPVQRAMCEMALEIMNDDSRRPEQSYGRKIAVARMIKKKKFKKYDEETIAGYISDIVSGWKPKSG